MSRVPRIRFKGFEEDWEQRKWIDVVDISKDMVDPQNGKYDNLPHISPGNIESFTGQLYDNVKCVKDENLISGKFKFSSGDIIYGKINPQLGKYLYATFSGLTSADAYVLNAKNDVIQKYLYTIIQTRNFFEYSVSVSMRSGMPKINRDELNAYSFFAPVTDEQLKIGNCILKYDHLITLHQRKLEKLKIIKKSMLENLFPQNGEKTPKIRFSGFTKDWEQRKLGEIADKVVEKNFQLQERDVFTNSAEFGIIDQKNFFDHEIVNKNNIGGYYIVSPNDFVYNPRISVTAPVGPINRNKLCKRGIMSPLYTVFHPRNMNETFLEFYFRTNKWHKFMEYNGDSGARSDRFSIKTELFYAMTIPFPSHKEQSKVGICFESLDHLITLHQLEPFQLIFKAIAYRIIDYAKSKPPSHRK